ncbi:RICIN domain-containing protein [Xanthobacter sp. V4C-4]|uniref:RICIN domain-containing protein n=1 Tax=Xanthobacter cornucopiae TaxID=3119924 RepID=UPI0037267651
MTGREVKKSSERSFGTAARRAPPPRDRSGGARVLFRPQRTRYSLGGGDDTRTKPPVQGAGRPRGGMSAARAFKFRDPVSERMIGRPPMFRTIAIAAGSLLLLPTMNVARAADAGVCVTYANAMVAMTVRGQKAKCSVFTPAGLNWDGHFNWCGGQDPAKVRNAEESWSARLDGCLFSAQAQAQAAPPGKPIVHELSGKCIVTVGGPATSNGTDLVIWNCKDARMNAANRWELTQNGQIRNATTGKCIDVSGAPGVDDGRPIQVWDCEGTANTDQRWALRNGFIVNQLSNKCIDVSGAPGTADGSKLLLWTCETSGRNPNGSTTDQRWRF